MKRSILATATIALLALGSAGASAQYYAQPYDQAPAWNGGYDDRRERWREHRRERDEARIAEAARREAAQIDAEREQRRAWRRQMRDQGFAPGYGQNGWQGGPAWGGKN